MEETMVRMNVSLMDVSTVAVAWFLTLGHSLRVQRYVVWDRMFANVEESEEIVVVIVLRLAFVMFVHWFNFHMKLEW